MERLITYLGYYLCLLWLQKTICWIMSDDFAWERESVCVCVCHFVCVILYFIITSTNGIFIYFPNKDIWWHKALYLHSTTFPTKTNIKYNTYLAPRDRWW
jgi:hypothetical protein